MHLVDDRLSALRVPQTSTMQCFVECFWHICIDLQWENLAICQNVNIRSFYIHNLLITGANIGNFPHIRTQSNPCNYDLIQLTNNVLQNGCQSAVDQLPTVLQLFRRIFDQPFFLKTIKNLLLFSVFFEKFAKFFFDASRIVFFPSISLRDQTCATWRWNTCALFAGRARARLHVSQSEAVCRIFTRELAHLSDMTRLDMHPAMSMLADNHSVVHRQPTPAQLCGAKDSHRELQICFIYRTNKIWHILSQSNK